MGHGPRTHPNHIFTWEAGDKAAADAAFANAAVTVREEILNPRVHPCPLETCGCVASFNKATGYLTVYMTTQAPHLVRTVLAMLSGVAESKIRVVGGDIGGGFGNKVPVYPGYVVAIVASIVTGVPVKWIESRIDNISTTGFARDYHGVGELAADEDGRIKGLRFTALADHGAFNSHVSATKLPAGLFSICTGSYDIPNAYCRVDAVYTNKAPGGVAYRCSLRVTEAVYLIERMIDVLALKLGIDKAEIRRRNFVKAEQFPYTTSLGWTLDSGAYHAGARQGAEGRRLRGPAPRAGGATRRPEGRVADGHRHRHLHRDRRRRADQGLRHPGHRPVRQLRDPRASHRRRDRPAGHHDARARATPPPTRRSSPPSWACRPATSWWRRATPTRRPTAPAPGARAPRRCRARPPRRPRARSRTRRRRSPPTCWKWPRATWNGRSTASRSRATPAQAKTMKEICMVAHTGNLPPGMEQGLNAVAYYDPPNMTYPFGAYLCVVDVDKYTGEVKVRRFYALDDCGTRINPMVIEGQIHGGLTEAFAVAMGQQMPFDENGNHLGNSLMDYFLPTAMETPHWETDHTVTPCPHHPIGAKGVAESPHVGGIPCFSNAVIDAFAHLGVTHMDMPHTAYRVWQQCHALGIDQRT